MLLSEKKAQLTLSQTKIEASHFSELKQGFCYNRHEKIKQCKCGVLVTFFRVDENLLIFVSNTHVTAVE